VKNSYDKINPWIVENGVELLYDIFARNNQLILIQAAYWTSEQYGQDITVICNGKTLQPNAQESAGSKKARVVIYDVEDTILHLRLEHGHRAKELTVINPSVRKDHTLTLSAILNTPMDPAWVDYYQAQGVDEIILYFNGRPEDMTKKIIPDQVRNNPIVRILNWNYRFRSPDVDLDTGEDIGPMPYPRSGLQGQMAKILHTYYKYINIGRCNHYIQADVDEYLHCRSSTLKNLILDNPYADELQFRNSFFVTEEGVVDQEGRLKLDKFRCAPPYAQGYRGKYIVRGNIAEALPMVHVVHPKEGLIRMMYDDCISFHHMDCVSSRRKTIKAMANMVMQDIDKKSLRISAYKRMEDYQEKLITDLDEHQLTLFNVWRNNYFLPFDWGMFSREGSGTATP
jgi:hypothetical protein